MTIQVLIIGLSTFRKSCCLVREDLTVQTSNKQHSPEAKARNIEIGVGCRRQFRCIVIFGAIAISGAFVIGRLKTNINI